MSVPPIRNGGPDILVWLHRQECLCHQSGMVGQTFLSGCTDRNVCATNQEWWARHSCLAAQTGMSVPPIRNGGPDILVWLHRQECLCHHQEWWARHSCLAAQAGMSVPPIRNGGPDILV